MASDHDILNLEHDQTAEAKRVIQVGANGSAVTPATAELATTLNELVETLNELTARLATLASVKQTSNEALRTMPVNAAGAASTITTVTGVTTVATVTNLTNLGTSYPAREASDDMNNTVVTLANINNVVIT